LQIAILNGWQIHSLQLKLLDSLLQEKDTYIDYVKNGFPERIEGQS
jgi:hypothetical protein